MSLLEQFKKITTIVLDVDGVLTDGTLWLMEDGQMVRRMNIKDGYAMQLAIKKGYRLLIISGGQSEAVRDRLQKLGIAEVHLKVEDKAAVLEEYRQRHSLEWDEMVFVGDDIPDFAAMQLVGIACAPADAASEIKQIAAYISPNKGGEGCVRDIIEKIMKLQGNWKIDVTVSSK